jgi:hypothetical protein
MIEATTIDALSSIALLIAITLMYPTKRLVHVCTMLPILSGRG